MRPLRPCFAAAVVAAVVAAPVFGCSDRPAPSPIAHAADPNERAGVDPLPAPPPTTAPPTTTTTTAPPPPPTTVAPPPPIVPLRRPTPAPAPAPPPPPAPAPAPPPPPAPPAPAPKSSDEARALQLVNSERAKLGVAPLQVSNGAQSVARSWSAHMSRSGMAHNPDLGGALGRAGVTSWTSWAENVGYGSNVDQLHAMFMQSAGHRANIVEPRYSHVGIGVVHSGGTVWITMDFVGF